MAEPAGKVKKHLVICPECDAEVDLEQTDECAKCGLNVQLVMDKHRYNKALRRIAEREEGETRPGKKKPSGWNPFE